MKENTEMEYSINKLSRLSGVTTRTLRYYDEINLLKPVRVASSGYRIYGAKEVDRLQQILIYRELEFSLDEIRSILQKPDVDVEKVFESHLRMLREKQEQLNKLIHNVTKSMAFMKGEITMSDIEKFEGLKQNLIDENEKKYGEEIRSKYGDKAIEESNQYLKNMPKEQYEESIRLSQEFDQVIREALETGDPAGELAQKACDLHRRWLEIFYPKYNKEYHKNLGEMYVCDERFKAHYEKIAPGCTEFLRDAIMIYTRE